MIYLNGFLRSRLVEIAKKRIKNDMSHAIHHTLRVMNLGETIAKAEKADLDVVIPAALFHDLIVSKGRKKAKAILKKAHSKPARSCKVLWAIQRTR